MLLALSTYLDTVHAGWIRSNRGRPSPCKPGGGSLGHNSAGPIRGKLEVGSLPSWQCWRARRGGTSQLVRSGSRRRVAPAWPEAWQPATRPAVSCPTPTADDRRNARIIIANFDLGCQLASSRRHHTALGGRQAPPAADHQSRPPLPGKLEAWSTDENLPQESLTS